MNPIAKEPVAVQVLAGAVVWLAARYGLSLPNEVALQIAGGAVVVLAPFVRQLVSPTVKAQATDPAATKTGTVRVKPTTYHGGYESGDVEASELRPPSTGVRRPESEPPRE